MFGVTMFSNILFFHMEVSWEFLIFCEVEDRLEVGRGSGHKGISELLFAVFCIFGGKAQP